MNNNYKNGQAMLLSVILITSAVLAMATLVGGLMVYEIRYSSDVISSAKALFAADAGIECAAYKNNNPSWICGDPNATSPTQPQQNLDNGAYYRVSSPSTGVYKSVGRFRNTARSFTISF